MAYRTNFPLLRFAEASLDEAPREIAGKATHHDLRNYLDEVDIVISSSEKEKPISPLERAAIHWQNVIAVTERHYREVPYAGAGTWSWSKCLAQVQRDIEIARQAISETQG